MPGQFGHFDQLAVARAAGEQVSEGVPQPSPGSINEIPVRNLWLLVLYASRFYKDCFRRQDDAQVDVEDNPDDIPNLVAEFLAGYVERRLARGRSLTFGYRTRQAVLSRVRGHINFLHTERHRLLERGKVACRFDELTADIPRNRLVRAALDKLARVMRRHGHREELTRQCRSLATTLGRMGVALERPDSLRMHTERFGHHDAEDRQMVAAARLALDLALPTETPGTRHLASPNRDDLPWIYRLYERAVAGFYRVVLPSQGWRVSHCKQLPWPLDPARKSAGIEDILPGMQTDITLEHPVSRKRIVIDTKFNPMLKHGQYRKETLRSSYIYQIYAYLRSQENPADPPSISASGLVLHPSAGEEPLDEWAVIQGHQIRFATVNLAAPATEIRHRLLQVIAEPAMGQSDNPPGPPVASH